MLNRVFYRTIIIVVVALCILIASLPTPDASAAASSKSSTGTESATVERTTPDESGDLTNQSASETSMETAIETTSIPAALADFEPDTPSIDGLLWTTTTDSMMGGNSEATARYISPGADGSETAWEVVATNAAGFPYPWSGFYLDASSLAPADISNYQQISFSVRGTPARYRFMLFTTDAFGAPPTIEFDVTQDWQSVDLMLSDASAFNPDQFMGFAIVTPVGVGEFTFAIDNVKLVQ
ncbi:MAG: CIA30 family protein [Pseudomonadota bacterium]